jgi:hypothetical protein
MVICHTVIYKANLQRRFGRVPRTPSTHRRGRHHDTDTDADSTTRTTTGVSRRNIRGGVSFSIGRVRISSCRMVVVSCRTGGRQEGPRVETPLDEAGVVGLWGIVPGA